MMGPEKLFTGLSLCPGNEMGRRKDDALVDVCLARHRLVGQGK